MYFCDMKNVTLPSVPFPTEEEKKWVTLLATGQKANDVAESLGFNRSTFAYHLKYLRVKYNCRNTTQLISFFLRNNFID